MSFRLVACLVLHIVVSSDATAQAILRGVVRDTSGRALAGAQVLLDGSKYQARTDSGGGYSISADPGSHTVLFRQLGYEPQEKRTRLVRGEVVVVNATLVRSEAPELDTVTVRGARPRGVGREAFEERRALGLGKFVDSAQIRKWESRRTSEVLRELGVRMWATKGAIQQEYAANPIKLNNQGQPSCFMTVILDGTTIYRSGSNMPPPDFRREFQLMSLESIEVYRGGAQVPQEFSGRGVDCGVIVLWTRRGK
jgi:hypothetical protein